MSVFKIIANAPSDLGDVQCAGSMLVFFTFRKNTLKVSIKASRYARSVRQNDPLNIQFQQIQQIFLMSFTIAMALFAFFGLAPLNLQSSTSGFHGQFGRERQHLVVQAQLGRHHHLYTVGAADMPARQVCHHEYTCSAKFIERKQALLARL